VTALSGVRVLDMTTAIAGPYCGQVLADLGADVIKVEHPGRALNERVNLCPPDWEGPPFSPFWLSANRNKRSVTLNLKRAEGKEVLADLVRVSDVVLENFGADARPHLADERWAWSVNPRVVWASLSFCGRTGPDSELDGYDLLAQARSGILSITGQPDAPPTKAGNSLADYLAGTHLAIAVLAALRQRDATGRGELVDISLLESAVACLDGYPMWYSIAGVVPPRVGNAHPTGHFGYAMYECTDGYIVTSVSVSRVGKVVEHVLQLTELLPLPEPEDPTFRVQMTAVVRALAEWAAERTVEEACAVLTRAAVPNAPVHDLAELWDDEQLIARGMFLEYEYGDLGTIRTIGSPFHLSDSPREVRRLPPGAGQHNEDVLINLLGYDETRVAELTEGGVLWDWGAAQ
jgi:crotonobetainyl-CoA:carnitine CoA-transferase CaiB-like acyl-CoA transferase